MSRTTEEGRGILDGLLVGLLLFVFLVFTFTNIIMQSNPVEEWDVIVLRETMVGGEKWVSRYVIPSDSELERDFNKTWGYHIKYKRKECITCPNGMEVLKTGVFDFEVLSRERKHYK